jgi:hypothetical protein
MMQILRHPPRQRHKHCIGCGIRSLTPVCRTCAAWSAAYHYIDAARRALRETRP